MLTMLRGSVPVFVNPCGTLAGPITIWSAWASTVSSPTRNLTWPLSRMKTSGYGCTWSPTPAPGGVDTMKLVAWMPPNFAPSNRIAVGLNRKAAISITCGSFTSGDDISFSQASHTSAVQSGDDPEHGPAGRGQQAWPGV